MNTWNTIYRCGLALAIIMGIILAFAQFSPQLRKYQKLQVKKQELVQNNQKLKDNIAETQDKRERFNSDPEFLKHVARDAGMVETNEILFKFTNASPQTVEERIP